MFVINPCCILSNGSVLICFMSYVWLCSSFILMTTCVWQKLHETILSQSELTDSFKSMLYRSKQLSTAQMCAGKTGAVTLKAHGVGPPMYAWLFSYKLMWLGDQAHCSTKNLQSTTKLDSCFFSSHVNEKSLRTFFSQ